MTRFGLLLQFGALVVAQLAAQGQPAGGRLNGREASLLNERIAGLMEATTIVIPELARAGEPLLENFRHGIRTLETGQIRDNTGVLYTMLTNARAYLQLSDVLPASEEFGEDVRRQLSELRDGIRRLDGHFRATLEYRERQALGSDRDNLGRYENPNSLVGPPDSSAPRVVFLGDSITDAWDLNQYFPGKPYINRGISGQITGQMLGRMKADVIDLQPRVVVLLGGTNDLARGVPNKAIRHNVEMIGTLAEATGSRPILGSILPVSDYHVEASPRFLRTPLRDPARILSLNDWIRGLCASKRWVYLDYHSAMADESGRLRRDLADDGLHPNTEGYKVMAPLVEGAIESALGGRRRRSRR